MDDPREELLAGARFALEQHGGFGVLRYIPNLAEQELHRRTARIDIGERVRAVLVFKRKFDPVAQGEEFDRAIDDRVDTGEVDRLDQEIVGAQPHRFDRIFHCAIGRQHDDQRLGRDRAELPERFDASHAGHLQVQQDEVRRMLGDGPDHILA